MANNANNKGIKNSWSLIAFRRMHGKPQLADLKNKETGEPFKSVVFTNADDVRTFASFSSNLGELSKAELMAQLDDLQVVELDNNGKPSYKICRVGNGTWEDLDF